MDNSTVTGDKSRHISNTQRENVNAIFTSEKLDKSDELSDALKDLTISGAKYYESDTVTASGTQGDPTRNLDTVTHTSISNETVTHTSNGKFEHKLLSNWTIPVVVLTINPSVDHRIALIAVAPQKI